MIYLLGDNHGKFDYILPAIEADRNGSGAASVIFLGDIEPQRPFRKEVAPLIDAGLDVYWIRGNHDTDSPACWQHLSDAMECNLDGCVVEIDGLRIAGLGGVFRGEVWYPPAEPLYPSYEDYCRSIQNKRPLRLRRSAPADADTHALQKTILHGKEIKHQSTIFPDVYWKLVGMRADILVTHEAPACHPHGFAAIDELAGAMGVRMVCHGHHHDSRAYPIAAGQATFLPVSVGYRDIKGISTTGDLFGVSDILVSESGRAKPSRPG